MAPQLYQLKRSGSLRAAQVQAVQGEATGTENCHLQQTAGDRDVLQEVHHLVRVSEVGVECERGDERESSHQRSSQPSAKTEQQRKTQTHFDQNGDEIRQIRKRQPCVGNVGLGSCGRRKFAKAADKEQRCQQGTANSGNE